MCFFFLGWIEVGDKQFVKLKKELIVNHKILYVLLFDHFVHLKPQSKKIPWTPIKGGWLMLPQRQTFGFHPGCYDPMILRRSAEVESFENTILVFPQLRTPVPIWILTFTYFFPSKDTD